MIRLPKLKHTDGNSFFLIAGPCAIEGEDIAMEIAERVGEITDKLGIPYIFKGSYRKANRSRIDSFTGIGDEKALDILAKVGDRFDLPRPPLVLTCSRFQLSFAGKPTWLLRQLRQGK